MLSARTRVLTLPLASMSGYLPRRGHDGLTLALGGVMSEFYKDDNRRVLESQKLAQQIALGPIAFQAARLLRDLNILQALADQSPDGLTLQEISDRCDLRVYAVQVLLESGLSSGIVTLADGRYFITLTGRYLLEDEMTRVNMDFVHDVCYKGLYHLEEAVTQGKPAGLQELGPWPTIYEGLSALPAMAQKSWLAFDHYYSDQAFPEVLPLLFRDRPATLLDVGGNTGRWAIQCTQFDPDVAVTIVDLPEQLSMARINVDSHTDGTRVQMHPADLLAPDAALPEGFAAIWMSQFLDCFPEEDVVRILTLARRAMDDDATLYILEVYWDRQTFETAAYCLNQCSLYFTALANGNSKFYRSDDMIRCIEAAGLKVVEEDDHLGLGHTLLRCKKA